MKRSDINEEEKAEKFKLLMDVTDKKLKLKKRRTWIEEMEGRARGNEGEDHCQCRGRQDVGLECRLFGCRRNNDRAIRLLPDVVVVER